MGGAESEGSGTFLSFLCQGEVEQGLEWKKPGLSSAYWNHGMTFTQPASKLHFYLVKLFVIEVGVIGFTPR